MHWLPFVAHVFGGVFLANAVPHSVAGIMGRPFQTPFAKPPGEGLSSSTVNVAWGLLNVVIGYLLLFRAYTFDIRASSDAVAVLLGAGAISLMLARHFGRFHGGNQPERS